jgi:hypothetical protein
VRDAYCARITNRWLLDQAYGSTVVDSVGTWNGTVGSGVSFATGAAVNNGTGIINLGNRTFGGSMSVAFWLQPAPNSASQQDISVFSFGSGNRAGWSNEITLAVTGYQNSGPWIVINSGSAIGSGLNSFNSIGAGPYGTMLPTNSTWVHFALTVNGDTGYSAAYINGAQVFTTNTTTNVPPVAPRTMLFGSSNWGTVRPYYTGAISDVQFAAGNALTAGDIANMFAGNGCPFPPPSPTRA